MAILLSRHTTTHVRDILLAEDGKRNNTQGHSRRTKLGGSSTSFYKATVAKTITRDLRINSHSSGPRSCRKGELLMLPMYARHPYQGTLGYLVLVLVLVGCVYEIAFYKCRHLYSQSSLSALSSPVVQLVSCLAGAEGWDYPSPRMTTVPARWHHPQVASPSATNPMQSPVGGLPFSVHSPLLFSRTFGSELLLAVRFHVRFTPCLLTSTSKYCVFCFPFRLTHSLQ